MDALISELAITPVGSMRLIGASYLTWLSAAHRANSLRASPWINDAQIASRTKRTRSCMTSFDVDFAQLNWEIKLISQLKLILGTQLESQFQHLSDYLNRGRTEHQTRILFQMSGRKNETSEWEDIQVKMGNWEKRDIARAPTDMEYDDMANENREFMENAVKGVIAKASLDELDELEDIEDERVLEEYRKKRIAEMKQQAARERFGGLSTISEPEYKQEVTDAPKDLWVVVFLNKPGYHFHRFKL